MRVASLVVAGLVLLAVSAGATVDRLSLPEKAEVLGGKPTMEGRDVGEDMATAIVITGLPYSAVGNSCDYLDDYDVACPYPESTSPDVVYVYDCPADVVVNVDLCASEYDTKVYIFANVEGDLVCCNDDADCGATGYQSFMENVFLYAGNTYFFIVDGYGGDCGAYALEILPQGPCDLTAPPGAIHENEPACGPGYVDNYNGGCNSDPPAFQEILPSIDTITIFGTSGTFDEYSRDTDWYEINISDASTVTFTAQAEFPVLIFILDANLPLGCDDPGLVMASATGHACEPVALTENLAPGLYWLWVGPSVFGCQPCGLEYIVEIDGYVGPSPVRDTSWATIKALYR